MLLFCFGAKSESTELCESGGFQDIAIAAAVGMDWEAIRPFVTSFRHFADRCARLVLFVAEGPPEDLSTALALANVDAVPISKHWPFIRGLTQDRACDLV